MKTICGLICVVLFLLAPFAVAIKAAEEFELPPIAQKAKTLVYLAYDYVREQSGDMAAVQKAFEKDAQFRDDENQLYLFMHAYNAEAKEAVCIAQGIRPELVGKNMWGLRTPNGRLLFQEEIQLIEENDEFWLQYEWLNPYTNTINTKQSFFKKIVLKDQRTAWIGCGFWKE